jgi:hypothetical protein
VFEPLALVIFGHGHFVWAFGLTVIFTEKDIFSRYVRFAYGWAFPSEQIDTDNWKMILPPTNAKEQ